MNRLLQDLAIDRAQNPPSALNDRWDLDEAATRQTSMMKGM
jgi:hypothetical protein